MNNKAAILIFFITLGLIAGGLYFATRKPSGSPANLDSFAQCLTSKGMVMYGAYWCSHCKNVKKLFGNSFQYLKYVECTVDTKTCTDNKVEGYPTFIFADGSRLEGEASLANFAQKTSCQYSTTNSQ